MSSAFGQWYSRVQQQQPAVVTSSSSSIIIDDKGNNNNVNINNNNTTSSSLQGGEGNNNNNTSSSVMSGLMNNNWFDGIESTTPEQFMSSLPVFNGEVLQGFSWNNMKASMESQMPKQIMGMGYQQRFQVFCMLLGLSALFFALAFFVGLPLIAARPQKFALSFTMGSITFMISFGILKGPMEHIRSLFQYERLRFTVGYIVSMLCTLYFTFRFGGILGYVLVLSASAVQLISLFWYLISFLPGGSAGLQYVLAVMIQFLKPLFAACARAQAFCITKCFGWMTGTG